MSETAPIPPKVDCASQQTGVFTDDVLATVEYYVTRLGFTEGFTWGDPVTFAGVDLDETRVFIQKGTPAPDGCVLYFVVGDADALFEYQRSRGVVVDVEPGDREYGLRDYMVRDHNGYRLCFGQHVYTVGAPVPIERVDVTVRLERRLAALLADLAAHKRMTVGECLEEILLHTSEPFGDGVASPHTAAQLRHIQELKRRHGIDYDVHASYRFTEETGG